VSAVAALLMCVWAGGVLAQSKVRKFDAVRVPPGVTPLTTTQADSLAQQLFVSRAQEIQAESLAVLARQYRVQSDSLWRILDEAAASRKALAPQDSIAALRATVEGFQKLKRGSELIQQAAKSQNEKTRQQALVLVQQAEQSLRKAVELNPHFLNARVLLASVYKLLAQRAPEQDKLNYDQAITTWETIVRLEPGEFRNYFELAGNYFAVRAWPEALENFEQAEAKLLAAAEVQESRIADPSQPPAAAIDSTRLFFSVYYQAQCHIKLLHEESAYADLRRAMNLAFLPQYRAYVTYDLRWLDWDRGNIIGAAMRDSTTALSIRGEFERVAKLYEVTIPKLRTERARREFGWKLAVIEFSNLRRKPEAAERMLRIVKAVPVDSLGAPTSSDTLGQKYFDNYATMCVNLGNENLETDRKLAYTYFMQSASLNWAGRGKSYFAMASLAEANPKQAVADAEKAYHLAHQLDPDEVINLHKLLIRNYRRLGLFDKAKFHFNEMVRLLGVNAAPQPGP
jgi:tetratricopeptide (TPR) repeat protein